MSQLRQAARARGRILLVEDDPSVARATIRLLERDGYEVVVTGTASEALYVLERDASLCCAMIDLQLGAVSGLVVVDWLRAMRPRINVIVASGQRMPHLPPRVAFLAKPYTLRELQQAIGQACR